MHHASPDWSARTAAALCMANRWLSAASVLMTVSAFMLGGAALAGTAARTAALALIMVIGALQLYLAVRIELDRRLFELAAQAPEGFAGFDAALRAIGLQRTPKRERSSEMRAAGLATLVRCSGVLLAAQLILALVVLAVP